eukprot:m.348242 g.348242  ORF g.348242 m.348242 type:complete len:79 (+) comp27934_c4_seq2:3990-4226(+)
MVGAAAANPCELALPLAPVWCTRTCWVMMMWALAVGPPTLNPTPLAQSGRLDINWVKTDAVSLTLFEIFLLFCVMMST